VTRIDRRQMLILSLGAATASTMLPKIFVEEAHAAPLPPLTNLLQESEQLVEKAQVVVIDPRRRRRRRRQVCWWRRGRRVCEWRW
jgi:hypothetical protein